MLGWGGGDVKVPCTCTHATLRAKEAQLGRKQLESLTLKGRVEVDATVIRKVCEARHGSITYWLGKPSAATKTYHHTSWDTFVALVLSKEVDDAKLLCVPLPLELQSAGSRPPTESTYDVQSSELLSKLDVQNTHLFSDGNRAWAKCAQEAGIEWSQVKHSVNHRTMTHKGPKPPLQEKNSAASCRPTSLRESTGDGDGAMESSAGSSRSCWNWLCSSNSSWISSSSSKTKHCLVSEAFASVCTTFCKVTAGTQVIDKMWGHFDDFLPMSMHNKSKATRVINDQI